MPELPEVETVCRGLNQLTLHQPIRGGEVLLERTLAFPLDPVAFLSGLQGFALKRWQRRGKYLLGQLEGGGWLVVHLRMTGQLLWVTEPQPVARHTRVRLFFPADRELRFLDQRTFGRLWWVGAAQDLEQVIPGLARLGPEPDSPGFSAPYLLEALRSRRQAVKTALLNQGLVAGLGNIYADEALFVAGINPFTRGIQLKPAQVNQLWEAITQVLGQSISLGGTTFSTFLNPHGVNGKYGGTAWVYGRFGQPCRVCQTPIEKLRLGGRSTHFCPHCQGPVT